MEENTEEIPWDIESTTGILDFVKIEWASDPECQKESDAKWLSLVLNRCSEKDICCEKTESPRMLSSPRRKRDASKFAVLNFMFMEGVNVSISCTSAGTGNNVPLAYETNSLPILKVIIPGEGATSICVRRVDQ